MILGGAQVYEGDDYIVSLLTPEQVREVAGAAAEVDQATLRAGYDRIDAERNAAIGLRLTELAGPWLKGGLLPQ